MGLIYGALLIDIIQIRNKFSKDFFLRKFVKKKLKSLRFEEAKSNFFLIKYRIFIFIFFRSTYVILPSRHYIQLFL
jgi:hypothetical protein